MKKIYTTLMFTAIMLSLNSCRKDDENMDTRDTSAVPEFFSSSLQSAPPLFTLIADEKSQIKEPQDLDFNTNPTRPNELWIINKDDATTGGSTVMITNTGAPNQLHEWRRDGNAWHFMSLPSAISFSKENFNWGTSHNIQDANHAGGTFAGPTLWSRDLNIYARDHGPGTNGSHLDMLHGSPLSMGIESHRDNAFWVYDGYNKELVFYDFKDDHGPGMHDHSDGIIHRYPEIQLTRNPNIPSHLVLDQDKKWLYVVDGGTKRILRVDVTSGNPVKTLPIRNEPLAEHLEMGGVISEVFISESFNLQSPCGIELADNRLFISDYETGEIICFDINTKKEIARVNTGKKGIMGIKLGPDKKLYFVNALSNEVFRIDPL